MFQAFVVNPETDGYKQNVSDMYKRQVEILKESVQVCENKVEEDEEFVESLNTADEILTTKFGDVSYMGDLFCSMKQSLLLVNGDEFRSANSDKILETFTKLKLLSRGRNGSAFLATFKELEDLLIIKSSLKSEGDRDLIHEYFVGVVVANKMRKVIPNFSYVFGIFRCAGPVFGPTGTVKSWCSGQSPRGNYVIYEKIPGQEIFKLIPSASVEQVLSWVYQITLSINYGNQEHGFTHYDLHASNVIVRNINKSNLPWIEYPTVGDKTVWIKCHGIATMIDYGYARCEYEHEGNKDIYFKAGLEPFGIIYKARPFYDVWRFVASMTVEAYRSKNKHVLEVLARIISLLRYRLEFPYRPQDPESAFVYNGDSIIIGKVLTDSANEMVRNPILAARRFRIILSAKETPFENLPSYTLLTFLSEVSNMFPRIAPSLFSVEKPELYTYESFQ